MASVATDTIAVVPSTAPRGAVCMYAANIGVKAVLLIP